MVYAAHGGGLGVGLTWVFLSLGYFTEKLIALVARSWLQGSGCKIWLQDMAAGFIVLDKTEN